MDYPMIDDKLACELMLDRDSLKEWKLKAERSRVELLQAFTKLSCVDGAMAVFGSARIQPDSPYYDGAVTIGRLAAEAGIPVVTGGGPGLMEAANKGCYEAGGVSIGLGIQLPMEQSMNPYLNLAIDFEKFFTRKVCLTRFAKSFVIAPGGFGTMDEAMEILTLMQTGKMPKYPVVFYSEEFWEPIISTIEDAMVGLTISDEDTNLYRIIDTPEEVVSYIMMEMEHAS